MNTVIVKTADLTVFWMMIVNTLHLAGKPQKVFSVKSGCSQSAVSKHIRRKLTGKM